MYEANHALAERLAKALGGIDASESDGFWGIVSLPEIDLLAYTQRERGRVTIRFGHLGVFHVAAERVPSMTFALDRADASIAREVRRKVIDPGLVLLETWHGRKRQLEDFMGRCRKLAQCLSGILGQPPAGHDKLIVYPESMAGGVRYGQFQVRAPDDVRLDLVVNETLAVAIAELIMDRSRNAG